MMSQEEVTFRVFGEGDFDQYESLYNEVYQSALDRLFFKWKHDLNPFHVGVPLIYLACVQGRVVGANSFFPVNFQYEDQRLSAVQSGDTMVHPDFRGRKLFLKILDFACKDLAQRGYAGIFGFANNQSHRGFEKAGFDTLDSITSHRAIVRTKNFLKKKHPFLGFVGAAIDQMCCFRMPGHSGQVRELKIPEQLKGWPVLEESGVIVLEKNYSYFNWKYAQKPRGNFRGFEVCMGVGEVFQFVVKTEFVDSVLKATVLDYTGTSISSLGLAFKKLKHFLAKKVGVDVVVSWQMGNQEWEKVLDCSPGFHLKSSLFFVVKSLRPANSFFQKKESWRLVCGDADTA